MKRLRTVVQVNLFALRTLQARSWWGLGISAALLGLGVWLGLRDYSAGAWLSLIAGTAGLGREMWSLLQAIRAPSSVVLNRDADFAKELVARVRASDEELRDGFDVVPLPHGRGEAVVRSPAGDSWLRANPVGMEECQTKRDDVDRQLRTHAGMLETVLRCHARKSLRSVPPRALFNEEKLGLSDGISPRRPNVRVHRVGYFHSLLTNEAAAKSLEALGEDPRAERTAEHQQPDRAILDAGHRLHADAVPFPFRGVVGRIEPCEIHRLVDRLGQHGGAEAGRVLGRGLRGVGGEDGAGQQPAAPAPDHALRC